MATRTRQLGSTEGQHASPNTSDTTQGDSAQPSAPTRSPEITRTRPLPLLIPRPLVRIQPGPYSSRGHENRRRSGVSAYETVRKPQHKRNTKVADGELAAAKPHLMRDERLAVAAIGGSGQQRVNNCRRRRGQFRAETHAFPPQRGCRIGDGSRGWLGPA